MTEREERSVPGWVGQEQTHYALATAAAEVMCALFEADYQAGEDDLDAMMIRLKDLSAYSLRHAEILVQREGVELLALGMFFGLTSQAGFQPNQARLHLLSAETVAYHGHAERIEQEVARRNAGPSSPKQDDRRKPRQPRLF
jgi:hypothetical protein